MKTWLAIALGSGLCIAVLWSTSIPLGIPGEWTWERSSIEPDVMWNLGGGLAAAALFISFVWQGWRRLLGTATWFRNRGETPLWLAGLVATSFTWIWLVQEISPVKTRLGKSAFVLFYSGSSGYFTRARHDQPDPAALLAGYEDLMRQGDVLHTGTHPPGLFLIFHGLIAACQSSPELAAFLDATQSSSFREACEVISTNHQRRHSARPFLPLDRRVLWLATLLVMFAVALTVLPLYGLIRRHTSSSTAWVCAALWPAMPAVATFIPKSDTVFPLVGLTFLWLWLTAWDRRSPLLALLAGMTIWCGLFCSLAFLPVILLGGILTLVAIFRPHRSDEDLPETSLKPNRFHLAHGIVLVVGAIGFVTPTLLLWKFARVNLWSVWLLNYRNHAGFYESYPRTHWKWLLVNPLELSFAAGWPVALLALIGCVAVLRRFLAGRSSTDQLPGDLIAGASAFVWGLLWLTGKNSGEAARLWIMFLPWLIWLARPQIESLIERQSTQRGRQLAVLLLLAMQFIVCLLTVTRVSGFHPDAG